MTKAFSDVITACNTIFNGIAGIQRVYTDAPGVAPSGQGDLPCCIPILQRVVAKGQSNGYLRKDYTLKYYLLVATQGKDLSRADAQAKLFADRVPEAFFPFVQLGDGANIDHGGTSDSQGMSMDYKAIDYAGSGYVGFDITLYATIKMVIGQGS